MSYTVEQYLAMPPIKTPWKSDRAEVGFNSLDGHCSKCGKKLHDLRGYIVEWGRQCNVVVADFAGKCPDCNLVTTCGVRWYPRTGCLMNKRDNQWVVVRRRRPLPYWARVRHRVFWITAPMLSAICLTLALSSVTWVTWTAWSATWLALTGLVMLTEAR